MSHLILVESDSYTARTTLGKLSIKPDVGETTYFCEVLEDTLRPDGIKVKGETAIPRNLKMKVGITYSPKFKRRVLVLYTRIIDKGGHKLYVIEHKGQTWTQVYFHGGNKHEHTEGCPLVAFNRIEPNRVQGTAEAELFERVEKLMQTCEVEALFKMIPNNGK